MHQVLASNAAAFRLKMAFMKHRSGFNQFSDDRVRVYESRPAHARLHDRSRSRDRNELTDITNITRGPLLDPRHLNSRIMNSQSLPELMRHVRENRQGFDYICASAAVSKAAKMMNKRSHSDVNDFMELFEISRTFFNRMDARGLVNLVHSLALSGQCRESFVGEILHYSETKLRDFEAREMINLISTLASLSYQQGRDFIKRLLIASEPKLRARNCILEVSELVSLLSSLSALSMPEGARFVASLCSSSTVSIDLGDDHEPSKGGSSSSNMEGPPTRSYPLPPPGWTSGTLQPHAPTLQPPAPTRPPQAQALVVSSVPPPSKSPAAPSAAVLNSRIVDARDMGELVDLVKSNLGRLDFIHASAAVSKAAKILSKGKLSDMSHFEYLVEVARSFMPEMKSRELTTFLYALAKAGQYKEGLIKEILALTQPKLRDFAPQAFSNTIWALATLNYLDGSAFVSQLMKEIETKLRDFNPQNLTNTVWALAVLDHNSAPLFLTSFLPLAYKMADQMVDTNKIQCLQYLLLMEDKGQINSYVKSDPRYVQFKRLCTEANARTVPERLTINVFRAIRHLPGCSNAISQYRTPDGIFRIGISVHLVGGRKLAIEVDDPSHFLSDGKRLMGRTVLRNRLLENRGYEVVSIPLKSEWDRLQSAEVQEHKQQQVERDYLMNKLGLST